MGSVFDCYVNDMHADGCLIILLMMCIVKMADASKIIFRIV